MKKPHVFNRPMFNQGGTSAYGRGITSNLVSDEQRQRFNYGGRVGLAWGSGRGSNYGYGKVPEILSQEDLYETYRGGNYGSRNIMDQIVEQEVGSEGDVIGKSTGDIFYEEKEKSDARKTEADALGVSVSELDAIERDQRSEQTQHEMVKEELFENFKKNSDDLPNPPPPIDTQSDVIDWTEFAEGLYDKKSAKGEAQLGLAGKVLAAAFQPKKEAMAILGQGLGDFGKTATQRKKKMEDIAATGKMYDKIYKTRAIEKGKQDRLTAAAKTATDTPSNLFWGHLDAAKRKGNLKDKDYAYAYERASNKPAQIIKKEEDKAAIEANPEQFKDTVFVMGTSFLKLDNAGKLKDITQEIFESFKG